MEIKILAQRDANLEADGGYTATTDDYIVPLEIEGKDTWRGPGDVPSSIDYPIDEMIEVDIHTLDEVWEQEAKARDKNLFLYEHDFFNADKLFVTYEPYERTLKDGSIKKSFVAVIATSKEDIYFESGQRYNLHHLFGSRFLSGEGRSAMGSEFYQARDLGLGYLVAQAVHFYKKPTTFYFPKNEKGACKIEEFNFLNTLYRSRLLKGTRGHYINDEDKSFRSKHLYTVSNIDMP